MVAAELKGDITKFFDNIEDVIAQADEVDDIYVQVRTGLYMLVLEMHWSLIPVENWMPVRHVKELTRIANIM